MKKRSGFTLVEIMIVVAIIGLLAAIAIPSFVKARTTARLNACINNLRLIESAKEQSAMANNLNDGVAAHADWVTYLKGGAVPKCPANGTYTIGNIGTPPSCNITTPVAHVMP